MDISLWFGAETRNERFGWALLSNGLAQRVTRGSRFEVLNGHLASKHVQLVVQLCASAHGVTLNILRGVTYFELVGRNLAYAILLVGEEECQLGWAYLVAIKCICYATNQCGHEWYGFFCTIMALRHILAFLKAVVVVSCLCVILSLNTATHFL
jgi:hypothetical protein